MKKNKEDTKVKLFCKYCGYKIDKDKIKEHEEKYCDQNPKATNPVKGNKKEDELMWRKNWPIMLIFMALIFLVGWLLISPTEDNNYSENNFYKENVIDVKNKETDQFPNIKELHWDHMPITYKIINKKECGSYEQRMIWRGFNEIENVTEKIVWFKEVNNSADIEITCSFIKDCYEKHIEIEKYWITEYESICAHECGNAQITEYKGNIILKAEIEIIGLHGFAETSTSSNKGMSGFSIGDCGYPDTEIHEILHTFNFGHSNNPYNIMSPFAESVGHTIHEKGECKNSIKSIDESIISCLKYIYSNGKITGDCSDVSFLGEEQSKCPDGFHPVENSDSCCPKPNMVVEEGYCIPIEDLEYVKYLKSLEEFYIENYIEDFVWDNFPVTYSVSDCDNGQLDRIQQAEEFLEFQFRKDLLEYKRGEKTQINFYCLKYNEYFKDEEFKDEFHLDYFGFPNFPGALPEYIFENEKIKEVNINLFFQGLEVHEFLHGLGLVSHYSLLMEDLYDPESSYKKYNQNTDLSIQKLKELYFL